jgi:uncharacterized phiE125 gp8 family phage protein
MTRLSLAMEPIPEAGFDTGTIDWSADPLSVPFVRDQHLRAPDGDAETAYLDHLIRVSLFEAERITWRTLLPTSGCTFRIDGGFPWTSVIVIPRPPLISVESIDYVDPAGVTQTLTGSPAAFTVSTPQGPTAKKGRITPLYGEVWPTTRAQLDAVTVHLTAGYAVGSLPDDLTHGRLLLIGELYKQRSESVVGLTPTPAVVRALDLFKRYRAYG